MFTNNDATLQHIKVTAFHFGSYWKWKGVGHENIRAHNLKVLRKDLLCLCALYRVNRQREVSR